uniref:Reverse transcriptase domain-containing protein n=1 Tax=Bracon brevicornis TaxID=1563983 RepID=A0A6V7IZG8_9HYME
MSILRTAHINANSIRGHIEAATELIIHNNLHLLAVSETWLTPDVPTSEVAVPGFSFFRNDRDLRSSDGRRFIQGGGVGCYVSNDLNVQYISLSQNNDINDTEYLCLEITINSSYKLLIAIVYRRPESPLPEIFTTMISQLSASYTNTIYFGDFNCDLAKTEAPGEFLRQFAYENSLYIVPHGCTHFAAQTASWLDVIIIDDESKLQSFWKTSAPFAANHRAVFADYKTRTLKFNRKQTTFRDFRNCDVELLNSAVNQGLSIVSNHESDPDALVAHLEHTVISALDVYAPIRTRFVSRPPAPWMTLELRQMMKDRDYVYRSYRSSGSLLFLAQYREMRRKVKQKLKKSRELYLASAVSDITDPAELWQFLSRQGLTKVKRSSPLDTFSAEDLNSYYSSVASVHPACSLSQLDSILAIPPDSCTLFSASPVTCIEVTKAIDKCLRKPRGNSPDDLPLIYLTPILPSLLQFLIRIFNLSLSSGKYPTSWKRSLITPIKKINKPLQPSDTRPIASLCHLAKIFDTIIAARLTNYLEGNLLLHPMQSGFRAGHSTQSALALVTDSIRKGIEDGLVTILVAFDFRRAFDSMNHASFLLELRKFGADATMLRWFHSFLSGRIQAVYERDKPLTFMPITSGVPQGCTPGPICFLVEINTLPTVLRHSKAKLFADDFVAYVQCPPSFIMATIELLNQDVAAVADWADHHGLQLNASKTKCVIFGSDLNLAVLSREPIPSVILRGEVIPYSHSLKYLGVTLAADLRWNDQVSHISSKVNCVLHCLKFRGNQLPKHVKLLLVNALVIPHLDYAATLMYGCAEYLVTKMQRLMNRAARFMFRLRRDTHISPYRRQLGWITIGSRMRYMIALQMYRILSTRKPDYLYAPINELLIEPRRSLRHLENPTSVAPICRTEAFKNSFLISGIDLWSSLPLSLRNSRSVTIFKNALYKKLFDTESQIL